MHHPLIMQAISPQHHQPVDALLTSREAARYLGLSSHHTLEVWRSTGRQPQPDYIKVGRMIRYRQSALDAYLDACTVSGNARLS